MAGVSRAEYRSRALQAAAAQAPITLYCGFDPTAPSLHLGNLAQILTVRRFQQFGHRPLALVGGATGLIGDPKDTGERQLNPREVVQEWVARIRGQLERFYDFSGANAAVMVNNFDWTENVTVLEFMRDIGKHFSVNRMLDREAVAARLAGGGISYTEFSYQLLQSFDYLELYRRYDCVLQTGAQTNGAISPPGLIWCAELRARACMPSLRRCLPRPMAPSSARPRRAPSGLTLT